MAIQNHTDAPLWSLDDIEPYGSNPKDHPDEQVDKIASSIRRFGWNQSIVVDGDGVIIVGHGRRLAAKQLGETEAPVIKRTDLSEAEVRAYRLADNRVSESSWDDDLLAVELELLDDSDVSIEASGMDEHEAEDHIGPPPNFEPVSEADQPRLDETDDSTDSEKTECPECGHRFDV
jgi:ParB-like chromosome segregation protein Spo0J